MNTSDYSPEALDASWKAELCPICKKNPAAEPHICPFKEEIHGDTETLCTCCGDCEHQCAMDI